MHAHKQQALQTMEHPSGHRAAARDTWQAGGRGGGRRTGLEPSVGCAVRCSWVALPDGIGGVSGTIGWPSSCCCVLPRCPSFSAAARQRCACRRVTAAATAGRCSCPARHRERVEALLLARRLAAAGWQVVRAGMEDSSAEDSKGEGASRLAALLSWWARLRDRRQGTNKPICKPGRRALRGGKGNARCRGFLGTFLAPRSLYLPLSFLSLLGGSFGLQLQSPPLSSCPTASAAAPRPAAAMVEAAATAVAMVVAPGENWARGSQIRARRQPFWQPHAAWSAGLRHATPASSGRGVQHPGRPHQALPSAAPTPNFSRCCSVFSLPALVGRAVSLVCLMSSRGCASPFEGC